MPAAIKIQVKQVDQRMQAVLILADCPSGYAGIPYLMICSFICGEGDCAARTDLA